MLPPLRALVAFEAVARLGSIGAAARELCVTQAAVSQQLKSLETFFDTTLFERSSKGVRLTSAAQQYQPIVSGSLAHLKLQTQILFGEKETDVLSLRVNHTFCHNWLLPRLASFYQKYPFIRLDIQLVDWPSTTPCQNVDIELTNGKSRAKTPILNDFFKSIGNWFAAQNLKTDTKNSSMLVTLLHYQQCK